MYIFERSTQKYEISTLYDYAVKGFHNGDFASLSIELIEIDNEKKIINIKKIDQKIDILFLKKDGKAVIQMLSTEEIDEVFATSFLKTLTSLLPVETIQLETKNQKMKQWSLDASYLKYVALIILVIGVCYTINIAFSITNYGYMYGGLYVEFDFSNFCFGAMLTLTFSGMIYALSQIIDLLKNLKNME